MAHISTLLIPAPPLRNNSSYPNLVILCESTQSACKWTLWTWWKQMIAFPQCDIELLGCIQKTWHVYQFSCRDPPPFHASSLVALVFRGSFFNVNYSILIANSQLWHSAQLLDLLMTHYSVIMINKISIVSTTQESEFMSQVGDHTSRVCC